MIDVILPGLLVLLFLAPIAVVVFFVMLWVPMKVLGISLRSRLHEITYAEAVFFGLYAVACSFVVSSVFGRFV